MCFTANFGLMLSIPPVSVQTEMVYHEAPKTAADPGVSQLDACIDCFAPLAEFGRAVMLCPYIYIYTHLHIYMYNIYSYYNCFLDIDTNMHKHTYMYIETYIYRRVWYIYMHRDTCIYNYTYR